MTTRTHGDGGTWLQRFPAEFQAVVAACHWPLSVENTARLEMSLSSRIDWERFLAIVQKQRVGGLVHQSLSRVRPELVPARVRDTLRTAALELAHNNMRAALASADLTARLARAGIVVAVIKGAPLGVLAYASLAIRHSKDIDLLVAEHDIGAADALLQQGGHVRCVPPMGWREDAVREFRIYRSHYEYKSATGAPQIELHWRLQQNQSLGPPSYPEHRWKAIDLGPGLSVRTLDEIDLLCYLCLHGASHAWSRLKWVADIAAILRQNPSLGERLVERSQEQSTIRAAGQALILCQDLFEIPLPSNYRVRSVAIRGLVNTARRTLTAKGGVGEISGHPFLLMQMHLSHFLISGERRYFLTELRNKLLVPAAWTNSKASLPARFVAPLRKISRRLRIATRN